MGTLLPLFTYADDINLIEVSVEDGETLQEGDHTLRNGDSVKIFITNCEDEGKSWVIAGGYTFREFDNEIEFQTYFLDLQKGKIDLYK